MRDLIHGEADVGSDEEDEQSFDEETGEPRQRKEPRDVDMDDSSEEEDDDDEEAARAVREGFIIDDEDEEPDEGERRRKREKKRRRAQREEEEVLDDEDLDLIGEAVPEWDRQATNEVFTLAESYRNHY